MATGWLRGTVKEVVSGDTVVIMGPSRGGPPPEKRLTLASLIAPRMVGNADRRGFSVLRDRNDRPRDYTDQLLDAGQARRNHT